MIDPGVRTQFKMYFSSPTIMHSTLFEYKNGDLGLDASHSKTPRTYHISIKYPFFRENYDEGKGIIIQRLDSNDHKAGFFY